jgi:hypothetical protein
MLAIEVELNGRRLTTAGASDLWVLTAAVAAVGLLGDKTVNFRPRKGGPNDIPWRVSGLTSRDVQLHVSGITSRAGSWQEFLYWIPEVALKPGDVVTFRIVEAQQADPPVESGPTPTTREPAAAVAKEKGKRRGLTARSRATRRRRRAPKRGR